MNYPETITEIRPTRGSFPPNSEVQHTTLGVSVMRCSNPECSWLREGKFIADEGTPFVLFCPDHSATGHVQMIMEPETS